MKKMLSVLLVGVVLLTVAGCGNSVDKANVNNSVQQTDNSAVTKASDSVTVGSGIKLSTNKYSTKSGYSLNVIEEDGMDFKETDGVIVYDKQSAFTECKMIIYANGYSSEYSSGGDKIVTSLDECIGSCDDHIIRRLGDFVGASNFYKSTTSISITNTQKVTISGKELLRVDGLVSNSNSGKSKKLLCYYEIVNSSIYGEHQIFVIGYYDDDSVKDTMESYIKSMIETIDVYKG